MLSYNNSIFSLPQNNDKHSAWIEHIPFAFYLVESLKPTVFIELGTHNGNSYFSFCQAISPLNIKTNTYAVDLWTGDKHSGYYDNDVFEYVSKINNENYSHFSNLLKMSFDDALGYFNDKSVDLLHIDGLHTYESVKHDFDSWLPKMSEKGVIILHDTNVRERGFGVWRFMNEIKDQYPSMEFSHGHGLGIVCVGKLIDESFLHFVLESKNKNFVNNLFSSLGQRISIDQQLNILKKENQSYNRLINSNNIEITKLKTIFAEKDKEINKLKISIAEKDKEITKLKNNVSQKNDKLIKIKRLLHNSETTLAQLSRSLSWRITKPLRTPILSKIKSKLL
jgi:hypothetical protein